jgi:CRP-like cAMP-binding protein
MMPWPPRNKLLAALPEPELERLKDKLEHVRIIRQRVLAHARLDHVYFVEEGLISVLAQIDDRRAMEVWLIGREGVMGIPVILGGTGSPHRRVTQLSGAALRMSADDMRRSMQEMPAFSRMLLRYVQAVVVQTSQAGACNASHKLQQRLARWLLTAQDRCERDLLPLTHVMLARMLGVRRASVSEAIAALQKAGIIGAARGAIRIRDRAALKRRACVCYRVMTAEYERMQREFREGELAPTR